MKLLIFTLGLALAQIEFIGLPKEFQKAIDNIA